MSNLSTAGGRELCAPDPVVGAGHRPAARNVGCRQNSPPSPVGWNGGRWSAPL